MTVTILQGHVLDRLRELPDNHFHCAITSPPYWGLRSYIADGDPLKPLEIGLEETPEQWLARLVEVFREVRRVLRPDGVCFVNIGDSYASAPNGRSAADTKAAGNDDRTFRDKPVGIPVGLKAKDLVGQPWMLAFALRADGWWLRSDTVWSKPNPMPESVNGVRWEPHRIKDEDGKWKLCPGCPKCEPNDGLVLCKDSWRPTKAHEYVFMLTKSERYFADAEAVRENVTGNAHAKGNGVNPKCLENAPGSGVRQNASFSAATNGLASSRNLRSVWTIATEALPSITVDGEKLDHFASYPVELARRCILAGTSAKGCCPECGAPWARVVESELVKQYECRHGGRAFGGKSNLSESWSPGTKRVTTTGWRPTCSCAAGAPEPARILDCFGGSGRTALAAEELGRDCTLIELNPASVRMAQAQIERAKARRSIGDDVTREPPDPRQGQLTLVA